MINNTFKDALAVKIVHLRQEVDLPVGVQSW